MIVGVVPTIFVLLSALAPTTFAKLFQNPYWYDLIVLGPLVMLIISYILAFTVIFPRTRFDLWEPRESNEEYAKLSMKDLTKKLKEERIDDFESIRDSRGKDAKKLTCGYVLLIIGSLTLLLSTTWLSLKI